LIIGLSGALLSDSISFVLAVWVAIAGISGSMVDSLLGATIQAQYQCPECQKITERKMHCQQQITRQISGKAWMNNDWVNMLCSVSGVLFLWIRYQL